MRPRPSSFVVGAGLRARPKTLVHRKPPSGREVAFAQQMTEGEREPPSRRSGKAFSYEEKGDRVAVDEVKNKPYRQDRSMVQLSIPG